MRGQPARHRETNSKSTPFSVEVLQLASDVCAAAASSGALRLYPELMWQTFRCLLDVEADIVLRQQK